MTSLLMSTICVIGGLPLLLVQQLSRRYRQLFNEQTDAAACFSKAKPEVDPANLKAFNVACPDAAGNEVVVGTFNEGFNRYPNVVETPVHIPNPRNKVAIHDSLEVIDK